MFTEIGSEKPDKNDKRQDPAAHRDQVRTLDKRSHDEQSAF